MIQAFTETDFYAIIQTEDNRIVQDPAGGCSKYLFKFTNDLNGDVQYCYPGETIYNRYSKFGFTYKAAPDLYNGEVNLKPAGYWKYQVFQVSFVTCPTDPAFGSFTLPPTEEFVFNPAANDRGVVQGQVTKGKMFVEEKRGTEEVQYIQKAKSVQTLTIVNGGAGYPIAPALTIIGSQITQATATCTVNAGVIDTVTLTSGGSGYTENPTVQIADVGASSPAVIIAEINQTNYIYTG